MEKLHFFSFCKLEKSFKNVFFSFCTHGKASKTTFSFCKLEKRFENVFFHFINLKHASKTWNSLQNVVNSRMTIPPCGILRQQKSWQGVQGNSVQPDHTTLRKGNIWPFPTHYQPYPHHTPNTQDQLCFFLFYMFPHALLSPLFLEWGNGIEELHRAVFWRSTYRFSEKAALGKISSTPGSKRSIPYLGFQRL